MKKSLMKKAMQEIKDMRSTLKTAKTIAIANLGGGDSSSFVFELLKQLPKGSKSAVVEFPCLGRPRVSYSTQNTKIADLKKEQCIDQLILDYDRNAPEALDKYTFQDGLVDYLLIHPRSLQENPVVRKVSTNKTLIDLPLYLKLKMQGAYDFVFFVTQGTLIHPTTHFSLRVADATVLYSESSVDFVGNVTTYNRLKDVFGVAQERLFLFSADPNVQLKEAPIYSRGSELLKKIAQLENLETALLDEMRVRDEKTTQENIGQIEPIEFLNYKFHQGDFNQEVYQNEEKNLQNLTAVVRSKLQANHLDDYVNSLTDDESRQKVRYIIADIVRETTEISINMKLDEIIHYVQREITELSILQELLMNDAISNIDINGPDQIIVEENSEEKHSPLKFQSNEHYFQVINKICEPLGKSLTGNDPILDLNYRGFRICVVADKDRRGGVSARHPIMSIRKFPKDVLSDEKCVNYGNLSWEMVRFQSVAARCANIMVGGGTDSGKTTTMVRYPLYVPKITRILSIEDSEEMRLAAKLAYQEYMNLPSLLVKDIPGDEEHSFSIARLTKAALRLRPKVIAIGEMRDEKAAVETLIAMNTGHRIWTTIHSNSAADTPVRLAQLNGNTEAAAAQIASSIDIIVYQEKLGNGKRVITEIAELLGYEGATKPIMNPIFVYDHVKQVHERVGNVRSEALIRKMKSAGIPNEEIFEWCHGFNDQHVIAN